MLISFSFVTTAQLLMTYRSRFIGVVKNATRDLSKKWFSVIDILVAELMLHW